MRHRGKHPNDGILFSGKNIEKLNAAARDTALFLEKGYGVKSVIKIVGDKFNLTKRQRMALERISCSFSVAGARRKKYLPLCECKGKHINIDGYNVLITIESILSDGVILKCMDSAIRDMASIHGSYKKVEETLPAIGCIADVLKKNKVEGATWYLDAPISNSGRLKQLLLNPMGGYLYPWEVILINNPDRIIAESDSVAATSDSWIIDRCIAWTSIPLEILKEKKLKKNNM